MFHIICGSSFANNHFQCNFLLQQGSGFYISAGCAVATWKKQVAFCGGIDENEVCSREVIWCNGKTTRIISPMLTPRSRAAAAFVNGRELNVFLV